MKLGRAQTFALGKNGKFLLLPEHHRFHPRIETLEVHRKVLEAVEFSGHVTEFITKFFDFTSTLADLRLQVISIRNKRLDVFGEIELVLTIFFEFVPDFFASSFEVDFFSEQFFKNQTCISFAFLDAFNAIFQGGDTTLNLRFARSDRDVLATCVGQIAIDG